MVAYVQALLRTRTSVCRLQPESAPATPGSGPPHCGMVSRHVGGALGLTDWKLAPSRHVTTPDVEDIVVTGRTKSGGVLTLKSLPGWEAHLRDQGHGRGFLIRVQAGGSALAARVERTMPGTRWAQGCDLAVRLLHAVAEGQSDPVGLTSPRDDKPQRTNGVRSTPARKRVTAARTPAVVDPVQSLLPSLDWPSPELFPHNAHGNSVARVLLPDLLGSLAPLIITGYSSLDTLVPLLAQLAQRVPKVDQIRLFARDGTTPEQTHVLPAEPGCRSGNRRLLAEPRHLGRVVWPGVDSRRAVGIGRAARANLKRSGPADPRQALCDGAFSHGWVQQLQPPWTRWPARNQCAFWARACSILRRRPPTGGAVCGKSEPTTARTCWSCCGRSSNP
jgi:hypothetical protein